MRLLLTCFLFCIFLLPEAQAQEACQAVEQLAAGRSQEFSAFLGEEVSVNGETRQYRSTVSLPGFDQSYFERENQEAAPVFTARTVGFPTLEAAGKALDSLLQSWSACLRGYTFYKEENCRLGCNYYVAPNDSREVLFYATYLQEPGQSWYAIRLQMPAGTPMPLPAGLTLLAATHPPLALPEGQLDACQTIQLYLQAGANHFQDLLAPDGSLKVTYPEALSDEVLSNGTAKIVLAAQLGDAETELDEVYLITQNMLNKCLAGWSQLELLREDDADFLNDRQWLKGNQAVILKYEISKGGQGKNRLVLLVSVK